MKNTLRSRPENIEPFLMGAVRDRQKILFEIDRGQGQIFALETFLHEHGTKMRWIESSTMDDVGFLLRHIDNQETPGTLGGEEVLLLDSWETLTAQQAKALLDAVSTYNTQHAFPTDTADPSTGLHPFRIVWAAQTRNTPAPVSTVPDVPELGFDHKVSGDHLLSLRRQPA